VIRFQTKIIKTRTCLADGRQGEIVNRNGPEVGAASGRTCTYVGTVLLDDNFLENTIFETSPGTHKFVYARIAAGERRVFKCRVTLANRKKSRGAKIVVKIEQRVAHAVAATIRKGDRNFDAAYRVTKIEFVVRRWERLTNSSFR